MKEVKECSAEAYPFVRNTEEYLTPDHFDGKTAYRVKERNVMPKDSGETLMEYVPEFFNDYVGTWTKIHKCIRDKKPVYFATLEEAVIACKEHARKQPKIVWSNHL